MVANESSGEFGLWVMQFLSPPSGTQWYVSLVTLLVRGGKLAVLQATRWWFWLPPEWIFFNIGMRWQDFKIEFFDIKIGILASLENQAIW